MTIAIAEAEKKLWLSSGPAGICAFEITKAFKKIQRGIMYYIFDNEEVHRKDNSHTKRIRGDQERCRI